MMKWNVLYVLLTVVTLSVDCPVTLAKLVSGSMDVKPRIIVTSDGEIDDQCSMIRFLLYANEWDIKGIITSSSQYHWKGHKWAGDNWIEPHLNAYAQVYPNLLKHAPGYPSPDCLRNITLLGNVKAEGEMEEVTAGSQLIANVLLDETDGSPVWLQAWGGTNTIARALKTIEEEHPEKMPAVANKLRFFFIWEQDKTYQEYIKPHWGKYNIQTIISDQFVAFFYTWNRTMPPREKTFYEAEWMNANILKNHGPLCSLYAAHDGKKKDYQAGDFRSEGDTPAFLYNINNGLRSMESPDWGGWGGRYVRIRANTWLDPVLEPGYKYPEGRWYTKSAWGRKRLRKKIPNDQELIDYLKPIWRWTVALQNDFAARADWCIKPYHQANHAPVVKLDHAPDLTVRPRDNVSLSAKGTADPDGDTITYQWWQYHEADTYEGTVEIENSDSQQAVITIPTDIRGGQTVHIICEVTDTGSPPLTRYQRIVMTNTGSPTLHSNVEYGQAAGEKLLLDVSEPYGDGPFPVAIYVHGGGWTGGDKANPDDAPVLNLLTDAGFTWFSINYRLAPKHHWPACFNDVQTAIRWVKANAASYKGDPSRIALVGYSAGGHLACFAATVVDDSMRVQAVVGFAPLTDFVQELPKRGNILGRAQRGLLNRPQELTPESLGMLKALSPINYIRPGLPPFLFIHGDADQSVPYEQSLAFQAKLQANNVPCDLITLPGVPHCLIQWDHHLPEYHSRTIAWLRKVLSNPQ
jgi:acetyl esterase/lipase